MDVVARRERLVDAGLSTLLLLQGLTLFLAIPLGGRSSAGRMLLDGCHLAFAAICVGVLVRHRVIQAGVVVALLLLLGGPPLMNRLGADLHLQVFARHEAIAVVAFAFNGGVTALVARHVFAPGRVTVHRVRGAILLYLNVAPCSRSPTASSRWQSRTPFVGRRATVLVLSRHTPPTSPTSA